MRNRRIRAIDGSRRDRAALAMYQSTAQQSIDRANIDRHRRIKYLCAPQFLHFCRFSYLRSE